jgi:hypothetical protein
LPRNPEKPGGMPYPMKLCRNRNEGRRRPT